MPNDTARGDRSHMDDLGATLDLRNRDALFDALEARVFDAVVIGGGITGAGIARDAAMRGLAVALVEALDFASGTSSRSSKMIHGGLRYLAQGDLALVREAASERKAVQAIAPHLARETLFVMPVRHAGAVAKLRAALWTFEALGAVPSSRSHQFWSREDLAAHEPVVRNDDLVGAVVYPEYLTDDARLTLANIRSAAAAGAVVANYARVASVTGDGGRADGVEIVDTLPAGERRTARLRAKVIVNAAGPWVDQLRTLEDGRAAPRLALARGVHLVVPRERLPLQNTVVTPAADRRSVFAVPRGPMTYIGTTDTFHPTAEAWPAVTSEDMDYLFDAMAERIAGPRLLVSDIVSVWSGLRPLVAQNGKGASEVSRRDEVWVGLGGMVSIAGGKLTAYRQMAERVVDRVEDLLGRKASPCRTAREPLPGGDADPAAVERALGASGADLGKARRLSSLYGSEALSVGLGGSAAEAVHAVLREGALRLEDWWVRRSALAFFGPGGGVDALAPAAAAMAPLLGWSPARTRSEIEACQAIRARDMATLSAAGVALPV